MDEVPGRGENQPLIRSMTGYGRGHALEEGLGVCAEVRSVNARGREIRFRLPQELFAIEEDLRQKVQEEIARGRVDVTLGWDGAPPAVAHFALNRRAAAAMLAAWHALQDEHGLPDDPTAAALLALPGVLENVAASELDQERLARVAGAALDEALRAQRRAREREGARLAADLHGRAQRIAGLVAEIDARVAGATGRLAATLRERVRALLADVPLDEQRLAQEIALIAQRADVTEEQVRLAAHMQRCLALFAPDAVEIGRTLEFLVQEIRREINTLTAKTSDPEIDARSLAIRTELERIREQAANIE